MGGTASLEACKKHCRSTQGCVGIEFNNGQSRCEVWTRPEGIGTTVQVSGFQCFRYTSSMGTTATTTMVAGEFEGVDGGSNRACRGASSSDNAASYYTVMGGTSSIEACKNHCRSTQGCVGIEYNSGQSRCEVWTRPEGIGTTVQVSGFQCFRFSGSMGTTTTTTMLAGEFEGVDGGSNRACRGASSSDNAASYYTVMGGTSSLDACKNHCRSTQGCVGIEYNSGQSRCEVWTRPEGIGTTVQ